VLSIVVAHSANHVIGYRGELPWHLPSDLRRFRELTIGHTVVMGRKTYESLPPAHRPLRERRNVAISSNPRFRPPGVEVHPSLDSALAAWRAPAGDPAQNDGHCFVIGGASIYTQAMAHAERIYATQIEGHVRGDAFFPEISSAEWRCIEESDPIAENDHVFVCRTYERTRTHEHGS
jgi:dihydrofolate reductase